MSTIWDILRAPTLSIIISAAVIKWTEPNKAFRYFDIEFAVARSLDCAGHTLSNSLMNFGYYQFPNYYSINWATAISLNPGIIV
jgi:hypothetical protein